MNQPFMALRTSDEDTFLCIFNDKGKVCIRGSEIHFNFPLFLMELITFYNKAFLDLYEKVTGK